MSSGHAILSPSSSHRWLECPRAPRYEATLPESSSSYAAEGTLAHQVCEILGMKAFGKIPKAEATKQLRPLKKNDLWDEEMLRTGETFVNHLSEKARGFTNAPYVAFETRVDISDYVPEAFGRCDCIMIGGDTLIVTDYKHGKGVDVSPEKNSQLMLYALGALKSHSPLFGDSISNVELCVDQPRIGNYASWALTVEELLAWGESVKPVALQAFRGEGAFRAGDWCRFCRAGGCCAERTNAQTSAVDDFYTATQDGEGLSPEELGEALKKGETLVNWYEAMKKKALSLILEGQAIPGWKAVEGRGSRTWNNQDEALQAIEKAGIERALIYDTVPKSLAQLEKMMGVATFKDVASSFVVRTPGKPTLATAADKRGEYSPAASDFAGLEKN